MSPSSPHQYFEVLLVSWSSLLGADSLLGDSPYFRLDSSILLRPFGQLRFDETGVRLLQIAQVLFISNLVGHFVFYYLPPFKYGVPVPASWRRFRILKGLAIDFHGDGDDVRWPCSISWMVRRGAARVWVFFSWVPGWCVLLYALWRHQPVGGSSISSSSSVQEIVETEFIAATEDTSTSMTHLWVNLLGLCSFASGFVCHMTPITDDVAMGQNDWLHCVAAQVYIFTNFLMNEWILGVRCVPDLRPVLKTAADSVRSWSWSGASGTQSSEIRKPDALLTGRDDHVPTINVLHEQLRNSYAVTK